MNSHLWFLILFAAFIIVAIGDNEDRIKQIYQERTFFFFFGEEKKLKRRERHVYDNFQVGKLIW